MSRAIQYVGCGALLLFVGWSVLDSLATSDERAVLAACRNYFCMFRRSDPMWSCEPIKATRSGKEGQFLVLVRHHRFASPGWWIAHMDARKEIILMIPPNEWRPFILVDRTPRIESKY